MSVSLVSLALLGAVAVDPPNFPVSWTSDEAEQIAIAQGTIPGPDGAVCCAANAIKCQAQVQSQSGTHYWDGVGNQTRFDSAGQSIVTQYIIGKEMLVSPNGTCESFCPTQFTFDPSPFWPDASDKERITDMGKATVNGVVCQHYKWIEHILGIIKMQETDMYIQMPDAAGGQATPVWEHDILEPFGENLGTEDTHWTNFKPGQPDASLFKVTGVADCQESPNCGNDNMIRAQRRIRDKDWLTYAKYAQDRTKYGSKL